jgi:hypothetical protein
MLQIHLLDMAPSAVVETRIRRWADRLSRHSDEIPTCQLWVESPHGHHRKGDLYGVRIRLTVPGEEIAVDLQPSEDDVHLSKRRSTPRGVSSKTTSAGVAATSRPTRARPGTRLPPGDESLHGGTASARSKAVVPRTAGRRFPGTR